MSTLVLADREATITVLKLPLFIKVLNRKASQNSHRFEACGR